MVSFPGVLFIGALIWIYFGASGNFAAKKIVHVFFMYFGLQIYLWQITEIIEENKFPLCDRVVECRSREHPLVLCGQCGNRILRALTLRAIAGGLRFRCGARGGIGTHYARITGAEKKTAPCGGAGGGG